MQPGLAAWQKSSGLIYSPVISVKGEKATGSTGLPQELKQSGSRFGRVRQLSARLFGPLGTPMSEVTRILSAIEQGDESRALERPKKPANGTPSCGSRSTPRPAASPCLPLVFRRSQEATDHVGLAPSGQESARPERAGGRLRRHRSILNLRHELSERGPRALSQSGPRAICLRQP